MEELIGKKTNKGKLIGKIEISGGIGSTKDYNKLTNKPKINDITLEDNKTLDELGIQPEGDYPDTRVTNLEIDNLF